MSDTEQEAVLEPNPHQGSSPDYQAKENCHLTDFSNGENDGIASPERDEESDGIASPDEENDGIASPDEENDGIASPDKENEGIASPDEDDGIASPNENNEIPSLNKDNGIVSSNYDNGIASPNLNTDSVSLSEKGLDELDFEAGDECALGSEASEMKSSTEEGAKNKLSCVDEDGDDGECSDGLEEEDLEEGELKDDSVREENKPNLGTTKQVCRFFHRGLCFYGVNCRFLHVNAPGNYYSMFAGTPAPRASEVPHGMNMYHRSIHPGRSAAPDYLPPEPPPVPQPALTQSESAETAWERGLRHAKELLKRANKRKATDADFPDKSLNLGLVVNEKNIPDFFDKENDMSLYKKKRKEIEFPKYEDSHTPYYSNYETPKEREPQHTHSQWRQGFDNPGRGVEEIHYHREEREHHPRGRGRMDKERDKREFPKSPRSKERYRDDRLKEVSRSRVDLDYFDPWRRSKSPKGNARRKTRSRSGSYSSVSSYSYSDDRSFSTYSRSSSRSSSRSPHHLKRKQSPTITNPSFISPDKTGPPTNTFTAIKKPGDRGNTHRGSSRSRTPSISRSRSFSRSSISMDSVSSASSSIISNSSGEISRRQNSHTSILRKQDENPATFVEKKIDPPQVSASAAPLAPPPTAIPLPSIYLNYSARERDSLRERERDSPSRERKTTDNTREIMEPPMMDEDERDPLEETFQSAHTAHNTVDVLHPFPSLQHLLPSNDKIKEPFKSAPHKQQIKLTLLNKNTPKINSLPKKDLDVNRKTTDEPSKAAAFYVKGPLSPQLPPVAAKPTPVLVPKKSASSRRDELLKQLKAVEDAIARKRAKFG